MYFKKLATLFILFTLNLVSLEAEAQTSTASRIFLKDSSSVKIHDDTTLIACQNQEIWLYYKSCSLGDPVIWTNGLSGDSIKVTITSNLRAYCNSTPENPSEVLYIYFDSFPQKPSIYQQNFNPLYTCQGDATFFLNATCDGYRPNAIWQDNRLGLQYYSNQVGLYSAKCINQCGTSDSSTIFLVANTTPIPIAKVIAPTKFLCGNNQIQLTTNFSLIKNDTLKQQLEILWSNGSTDTSTIVTGAGTYFYRLKKPSCDEYFLSDSVTIINGAGPPKINLGSINPNAIRNDSIDLCSMESFNLIAEECTGGTITWNNGQTTPQILVNQTGTYFATCTLSCGTSQPSKKITVYNSNNCQIQPPIFSSSSNPICNSTDKILLTATCNNSTLKWQNPTDSINATISVPIGFYSAVCTVRGIESSSSFVNITPSTNSQTPAISANKTILCRGEDATLVATGCFSTNTIWSNGLTGAVIVVKTAGTYTASCSNACGPNLNSNAIIIRSDEQFPAYISISGLPNCDPDSATLTAVNCSSNSVVWSNGATTQSIKVGPGAYSATCQNICGFTVNLAEVSVSSSPQSSTPIISTDRNIVCNQEKAKLTLIGCLSRNILWSSGQVGDEILVGAGTYSARCSNGCDTSNASNIISILEATTPEAPRIFADTIIVCGTNKAVLTTSGCVNSTIRWSTGAISNTISVGVGSYTALCENLCGRSPNSNAITIETGPPPVAPVISASKGLVCGMEKSTLTATGCTNGTITWSSALGVGNTKLVGPGTYTATCTNSCGTSSQSNIVTINSEVFPSAPIIAANKNIICDGDSAILTASGCSGIINWSNGMTPFQIKITVAGSYTARCTNSCGTSTNSSPIVINKFIQPEIPILTVDNNQIAIGDTATLSVANCNGTVRWNNNRLGNSIIVTEPGFYSAICSNTCGTSDISDSLEIFRDSTAFLPIVKSNKLVLLPNELATLSFENCISNILWSNGSTSNSIEVGAGTYSVSCETSFGYFSSLPMIILENCGELCLPIQARKIR
jgi:hypothetical protein